jgi:tRNA U34 5-carboxymethylaminomethyl modifying GTPase MnmE/TrmE
MVEAEGVSRARQAASQADLAIWVSDASHPPSKTGQTLPLPSPHLLVANKTDLAPDSCLICRDSIKTSALTGAGLEALKRGIVDSLIPRAPKPGDAVPFTTRQQQAVERACNAIAAGDLVGCVESIESILDDGKCRQS